MYYICVSIHVMHICIYIYGACILLVVHYGLSVKKIPLGSKDSL